MNAKMPELRRAFEAAMTRELGHAFLTIVRPVDALRELLASDLPEISPRPREQAEKVAR